MYLGGLVPGWYHYKGLPHKTLTHLPAYLPPACPLLLVRHRELLAYFSLHGDSAVGFRDGDDCELAAWANKQRDEHRRGTLPDLRSGEGGRAGLLGGLAGPLVHGPAGGWLVGW